MAAYLNNVYLIDEMHICGPQLDQLRVKTVLSSTRTNLFATIRLLLVDRSIKKEYVFPISECGLCEKDNQESMLMRLQLGDRKFFAHRSRAIMINEELVSAVLNPRVIRIETMK